MSHLRCGGPRRGRRERGRRPRAPGAFGGLRGARAGEAGPERVAKGGGGAAVGVRGGLWTECARGAGPGMGAGGRQAAAWFRLRTWTLFLGQTTELRRRRVLLGLLRRAKDWPNGNGLFFVRHGQGFAAAARRIKGRLVDGKPRFSDRRKSGPTEHGTHPHSARWTG